MQVGIFPGSRKPEINRNLPIQIQAIENLMLKYKNIKCFVSIIMDDEILRN